MINDLFVFLNNFLLKKKNILVYNIVICISYDHTVMSNYYLLSRPLLPRVRFIFLMI